MPSVSREIVLGLSGTAPPLVVITLYALRGVGTWCGGMVGSGRREVVVLLVLVMVFVVLMLVVLLVVEGGGR